jgi:hypothetical protein
VVNGSRVQIASPLILSMKPADLNAGTVSLSAGKLPLESVLPILEP